MTLEQLRVFVAVAEREHMTAASRALRIAQSAVSHAISALETELRLALFDRIGRRIALTEAGRLLLEEARGVLAHADGARRRMAAYAGLAQGSLRLHASQTIAGYWLPARLAAFRARHEGIAVELAIGNTGAVAASVRAGAAELGFIEGAVDDDALEISVIATDRLVLVVAPDHSWVTAPPHDTRLVDTAWVMREPGSGTRSAFEAALAARGVLPDRLRVAMALPSNEAVRGAAEAGLGAAVVSASVAAPSLEAGLLHAVPFDLPARDFAMVRRRGLQPSPAAHAFAAMLADARQRG